MPIALRFCKSESILVKHGLYPVQVVHSESVVVFR